MKNKASVVKLDREVESPIFKAVETSKRLVIGERNNLLPPLLKTAFKPITTSHDYLRSEYAPLTQSLLDQHGASRPADCGPAHKTRSSSAESVDALGDVDARGMQAGLLGASSSQIFVASILGAAEGTRNAQDQPSPWTPVSHPSLKTIGKTLRRQVSNPKDGRSADYLLPPRKTADRLLDIHWNSTHIIFAFLDRREFMDWYEGLWSGEDPSSYIHEQAFYCILNIILASSYKLDSSVAPEEQDDLTEAHFQRAEKLLTANMLDTCHFAIIQALLVMGVYLQSTNMPGKCSQSLGLAIWIAQSMRLHIPETIASIENDREREMACRVWQGCILMDRVTSMTFGRATRIDQSSARLAQLPTPFAEEYLAGARDPNSPSRLDFYREYCRLHIILGDILQEVYGSNLSTDTDTHLSPSHSTLRLGCVHMDRILQFDRHLSSWRNSIKSHLQPTHNRFDRDDRDMISKRQANSLSLRFTHIRMLLYRPFFSKVSRASEDALPEFESQLGDFLKAQGIAMCTQLAQEMLSVITVGLDPSGAQKVLPPWWHVISYTYHAATVVIASLLCSSFTKQDSSKLVSSVEQAFRILEHYDTSRKSALRCKRALKSLYDKVIHPDNVARAGPLDSSSSAPPLPDKGSLQHGTPWPVEFGDEFSRMFDGTEAFWLNSAPFDPDNGFMF